MDTMRDGAISMADKVYEMVTLVEKGFMEHKAEYLAGAMKCEKELNAMEKSLTERMLGLSKSALRKSDKKDLVVWEQAIESLERMGDEAANLVERIEIKNAEHLLFSDMGVTQFNETYGAMKRSVDMMRLFLKGKSGELKKRIIGNGLSVRALVKRYREEHSERLVKGICTPMAANMYFDMLDFTGNLARHSSNIVSLF
ncbi:MAG: PhoU domain-containing protein [Candidatus Omnitrophota bacterium]